MSYDIIVYSPLILSANTKVVILILMISSLFVLVNIWKYKGRVLVSCGIIVYLSLLLSGNTKNWVFSVLYRYSENFWFESERFRCGILLSRFRDAVR